MAIENTYMGGTVYGGIQLGNGFDLQAQAPLDSRQVVPLTAGLQALIDGKAAYEGMIVYDEETKKTYQAKLVEGVLKFEEFGVNDSELDNKVDKVEGYSLVSDSEINKLTGISVGANKVSASETNGSIKIDDTETVVYTHPEKHTIDDIDTLSDVLSKKVESVTGKGLSTNDLTDELKGNYDKAYTHSQNPHAPVDAQANVIESITVNNTAVAISGKVVNITVPTGALANKDSVASTDLDSSLQTELSRLANVQNYDDQEVRGLISGVQSQINTIMNNPDTEGVIDSINEFTQYIEDHGTIAEGMRVDINNKVDKIEGKGLSTNDFTDEYKSRLDFFDTPSIGDDIILSIISGEYDESDAPNSQAISGNTILSIINGNYKKETNS